MPDYLVIVDDSGPKHAEPPTKRVADRLQFHPLPKWCTWKTRGHPVFQARSTPRSRGCRSETPDAFVALLDDDDAWAPTYLKRCEFAITGDGLDMVAAGIVYHGPDG